jgi:hypothetical protein
MQLANLWQMDATILGTTNHDWTQRKFCRHKTPEIWKIKKILKTTVWVVIACYFHILNDKSKIGRFMF